jgi:hypothetical protein
MRAGKKFRRSAWQLWQVDLVIEVRAARPTQESMMKSIYTLFGAALLAAAALSQPAFAAKVSAATTLSRVALNPQPLPPRVRPPAPTMTNATSTSSAAQEHGIIIVGGRTARVAARR